MNKEHFAKAIRIISAPSIVIIGLLLLLLLSNRRFFDSWIEVVISIIFLGVLPTLAYPIHRWIPSLYKMGRDGQREIAFILTTIGYSIAFFGALCFEVNENLLFVCMTYFLSVVLLTITNRLHFKASGHASSFTGAMCFLVYAFGWKIFALCVSFSMLVGWSSVYLKRHTVSQLFAGIFINMISFFASYYYVFRIIYK